MKYFVNFFKKLFKRKSKETIIYINQNKRIVLKNGAILFQERVT
ncbi:hypothetical protein [Fusobacterium sp.]|jgi:hypothetical protein|nr:hypothetical protein [Fusobacterium sp.]